MAQHDWTFGFSLEDIAHHARFRGCSDVAAARDLQSEWEKDEAERIADEAPCTHWAKSWNPYDGIWECDHCFAEVDNDDEAPKVYEGMDRF